MNAIIQFENYPEVARRFREQVLEPKLKEAGLYAQTRIKFQDFVDRNVTGTPVLPPTEVASQAADFWDGIQPPPRKTVWLLDLDPSGSSTADSSYGLCVLLAIATQFGIGIAEFLQREDFLSLILTRFPADLQESDGVRRLVRPRCDLTSLAAIWPGVAKIQNKSAAKVSDTGIIESLGQINQKGARIVLAHHSRDEGWLAKLIIEWLK